MQPSSLSRRRFCGMSATVASAGTLSSAAWAQTVAARVGVQTADLPNLRIKEVKAHSTGDRRLASIVTEGGVEGNCTLQDHVFHADSEIVVAAIELQNLPVCGGIVLVVIGPENVDGGSGGFPDAEHVAGPPLS